MADRLVRIERSDYNFRLQNTAGSTSGKGQSNYNLVGHYSKMSIIVMAHDDEPDIKIINKKIYSHNLTIINDILKYIIFFYHIYAKIFKNFDFR